MLTTLLLQLPPSDEFMLLVLERDPQPAASGWKRRPLGLHGVESHMSTSVWDSQDLHFQVPAQNEDLNPKKKAWGGVQPLPLAEPSADPPKVNP